MLKEGCQKSTPQIVRNVFQVHTSNALMSPLGILQVSSAFQDIYQNLVKRRQALLDLERMQVDVARHLQYVGPLVHCSLE